MTTITDQRLGELIAFTKGHANEAESILLELSALRSENERYKFALEKISNPPMEIIMGIKVSKLGIGDMQELAQSALNGGK